MDRKTQRTLVYVLRHGPEKLGLTLDKDGWTDLNVLLKRLGVSREELDYEMATMDKKRLEVQGNKIRAYYGHSVPLGAKPSIVPPDILYHGTPPFSAYLIKQDGIRPMDRQYVHLSTDINTALKVGQRRSKSATILVVDAKRAYEDGVKFYQGNEDIWLSDYIPPQYISSKHV